MKRLASICILLVFLFNVGGYYLIFFGVKHQARKDLLQRLDAGSYVHEETIVLTIPLSLPYPVQQHEYQRINGEFEFNGQFYKLVKQKHENDTLFLVCIRDAAAKKIAVAMADFSRFVNNMPASSERALDFLGKMFKDFNASEFLELYKSRILFEEVYYAHKDVALLARERRVDTPPPELFI